MPWFKSPGDVVVETAEKKAQARPDGTLAYVHSYPTAGGLRRDTERLMAAGWKAEAQVQARGGRVVVTWVRPPSAHNDAHTGGQAPGN